MRFDVISTSMKNLEHLKDVIFQQTGENIETIVNAKTYWLESVEYSEKVKQFTTNLLRDPIDEKILYQEFKITEIDFTYLIQVTFKPGVTDNKANSTIKALKANFPELSPHIATGEIYFIKSNLTIDEISSIGEKILANPLIQIISVYKNTDIINEIPSPRFPSVNLHTKKVKTYSLNIADDKLLELSKNKLWALSLEEMLQIKDYFLSEKTIQMRRAKNLPSDPTDIELEILAQTWSEHCKHKIFNANITYTESPNIQNPIGNKKIESIFKTYIKKATSDIQERFNIDWLISVFTDNAGIVRYDENVDFCLKVETHNSPSALDPYGGALTGILGVNRDILGCGIGAKPIANTNVLCFAPPNYTKEILEALPLKLKHPKTILRGVHRGIEDGGNKSGIPTVNGAIQFHDNYAGKPLVYCGTVGVLPQKINNIHTHLKRQRPNDYIVICGGSVGADGIHGATFSSLELDDNAPCTAVQIGDPLTQKRLGDFLIEARDLSLYNSVTDNGAGGLSSSVGEMAELTNGAKIDIAKIPRKYNGLSPYEVIISESQERMTFSVPQESLSEFMELAKKRDCNPANIGTFQDSGFFDIYDNENLLASLDMNFLHDSLKPMELSAHFDGNKEDIIWYKKKKSKKSNSLSAKILELLSNPNIKSKESLVRQFDHEVKASTVVKPFIQKKLSGPSDGAVLWTALYGGSESGAICVSSGLAPQVSHIDTYLMTQYAIDEAVRNAVSCGANPAFISVCDNYCWPDPIESTNTPDGKHKLAQLVRSTQALYDTAIIYGTPFISGKDSMKNDFIGKNNLGENIKISVPPTLLITALAKLDTIDDFMTTDFKHHGDLVYYLGPNDFESHYFSTMSPELTDLPQINLHKNKVRYELLHSLIKQKLINSSHDISDGGLIISIIESCFPNELGLLFEADLIRNNECLEALFFNEIPGGFIISVSAANQKYFEKLTKDHTRLIGKIVDSQSIIYPNFFDLKIKDLYQIWSKDDY